VGCCAAPRKGACSAPASSAHGEGDKPTTVVGWAWVRAARRQWLCGHGGARRGAASAAAMERKAGGRCGGEEGTRETWCNGRGEQQWPRMVKHVTGEWSGEIFS
jgi:hypothetical protein